MQLHWVSTNLGFLDFFILCWCLFDQAAIKETHTPSHPEAGVAKGPSQRARCFSAGNGFFTGHISAGLAFWLFPLLFLSFCASPIFMLKLTFGLLPHCPPSFIANNYPWYFGSGGLLCPSHLEQRVISSWNPLGKMPKYFLIRRGKNDNSLNLITPMYWVGQKIHFSFSITSYRKTWTSSLTNPIASSAVSHI